MTTPVSLHVPGTIAEHALYYLSLGWGLCSIPRGTKGPSDDGWNHPAQIIDSRDRVLSVCAARPDNGLGLVHAASGTCAIDVDHGEYFAQCLAEFGLEVETLFAGAPRIVGKAGRDKAIFRLPAHFAGTTHKLVWPKRSSHDKPVTIFELRCGPVQDVLPPTVHPDTNTPYRWRDGTAPWELETIPELPAPLVALWTTWNEIKPQLQAMCPWAEPVPPPKLRTRAPGIHNDVIGQFNTAHDVRALLEAHGYRRIRKRYLAPTSESGLAGIVILDDGTHCFSHHASDPLNDDHAHDAFDLFCLFEHGGDIERAVRSAAELLHIARLPDLPAVDTVALLDNARRKRDAAKAAEVPETSLDLSVVPAELLHLPGTLGHLVDHILASAIKPQRVLAVTAALAFGATMMGRIYASVTDLRTNLYLLSVAPSTAGKDHARRVVKLALAACGKKDRLGGEDIKSGSALLSALQRSPATLFQVDEFGLFLRSVTSPIAGSHLADLMRQLMQVRTSANTILAGPEYADQRVRPRIDLEYPCAVLHATTTGDSFWPTLSSQHVLAGFLNRFLVTHSENPAPERQWPMRRLRDIPATIVAWGKAISSRDGKQGGNLQGFTPDAPCVIGETLIAKRAIETFSTLTDRRAAALLGTGLDSLWGRAAAMAIEVALVIAGSLQPAAPVIDETAARWAIAFVDYWTTRLVADVSSRLIDSEFAERCICVARALRRGATRDGSYSEREIAQWWKGWRTLKPHERDEILTALVRNGDAIEVFRKGLRGPATRVWIARELAPKHLVPDDDEERAA